MRHIYIFLFISCFFSCASSQPLPSPDQWGDHQVEVAPGCFASSNLSNDRSRFNWAWSGPCVDGRAHGEGVRTVYFKSITLSVAQAKFKNGNLESFGDRYYFESGVLYGQKGPDNPLTTKRIDISRLPEWSKSIINSIPIWRSWTIQEIEYRKIKREPQILDENKGRFEKMENEVEENLSEKDKALKNTHRIF